MGYGQIVRHGVGLALVLGLFGFSSSCKLFKKPGGPSKGPGQAEIVDPPAPPVDQPVDFSFAPESNPTIRVGDSANNPLVLVAGYPMLTRVVPTKPFRNFKASPSLPAGLTLNYSTGVIGTTGSPTLANPKTKYLIEAYDLAAKVKVYSFIYLKIASRPQVTGSNLVLTSGSSTGSQSTFNFKIPVGQNAVGTITFDGIAGPDLGFSQSILQTPATFPVNTRELSFSQSVLDDGTFQVMADREMSAAQTVTLSVGGPGNVGFYQVVLSFTSTSAGGDVGIPPQNCTYQRNRTSYVVNASSSCNVLTCQGGTPTSFAVQGTALPAGLYPASNGSICGTPNQLAPLRTYSVRAQNTFGSATATTEIEVLESLARPSISYPFSTYYVAGAAIPAGIVRAVLTGGIPSSITVNPNPLNFGLNFIAQSGEFSGSLPPGISQAVFNVTATNIAGSSTTSVTFVNSPPMRYAVPNISSNVGVAINNAVQNKPPLDVQSFTLAAGSSPLPSGLTLISSSGLLTGTPTGSHSLTPYTVNAKLAYGYSVPVSVSIVIHEVAQAPSNLRYALNPANYTRGVELNPGNAPSWSGGEPIGFRITKGSLPQGVYLDGKSGRIYGQPTAAVGQTSVTIEAYNASGSTSVEFLVSVSEPPPRGFNYGVSNFILRKNESVNPIAPSSFGGFAPTSWTVTALSQVQNPPLGFLNGTFSGSPSVLMENQSFRVTATQGAESYSQDLSFTVRDLPPGTFNYSQNPANFELGVAIPNQTPVFSGPTGVVTNWFVSPPTLPTWLNFNDATGVFSGRADAAFDSTFTVRAVNASGESSAQIRFTVSDAGIFNYNPGTIIHSLLERPSNNNQITSSVVQNLGLASYAVYSGALPTGLILNPSTGQIHGEINSPFSSSTVVVEATLSTGAKKRGSFTFESKEVAAALTGVTEFTLGAKTQYSLTLGQEFKISPVVGPSSGRISAYEISPTELPTGVSFDSKTGIIAGPAIATRDLTTYILKAKNVVQDSVVNFDLSVARELGNFGYSPGTVELARTQNMDPNRVLSVPTSALPSGNWQFSSNPPLPPGLSFGPAGEIKGKPQGVSAIRAYTITAIDNFRTFTGTFYLSVYDSVWPQLRNYRNSSNLDSLNWPLKKNETVELVPVYTGVVDLFEVSPPLPEGLSINSSTGVISGSPKLTQEPQNYYVRFTNSLGSQTATLTLEVYDLYRFFSYNPREILNLWRRTDRSISFNTIATGLSDGRVFSIAPAPESPALPSGVELNSATGLISGTPRSGLNETTFVVHARNLAGEIRMARFKLKVADDIIDAAGFKYTASSHGNVVLQDLTVQSGTRLSAAPQYGPGGLPSTFIIKPELPGELDINESSGEIFGMASVPFGKTEFTITATNLVDSKNYKFNLEVSQTIQSFSYRLSNGSTGPWSFYRSASTEAVLIIPYFNTPPNGCVYAMDSETSLPPGLSLNSTTGIISGAPHTAAPRRNYIVNSSCANTGIVYRANVDITIDDMVLGSLQYNSGNALTLKVNETRANLVPFFYGTTEGRNPIASYVVSPELPAGLTLDRETGIIAGVASEVNEDSSFTITATNPKGSISGNLTLQVYEGARLPFFYNPLGRRIELRNDGSGGSFTANPTDLPPTTNYTFSDLSASLPAVGLSVDSRTGQISGNPQISFSKRFFHILARSNSDPTKEYLGKFGLEVVDLPLAISRWNFIVGSNSVTTFPNFGIVVPRANNAAGTLSAIQLQIQPVLTSGSGKPSSSDASPNLPAGIAYIESGGWMGALSTETDSTDYTLRLQNSANSVAQTFKIMTVHEPKFKGWRLGSTAARYAYISARSSMPPLTLDFEGPQDSLNSSKFARVEIDGVYPAPNVWPQGTIFQPRPGTSVPVLQGNATNSSRVGITVSNPRITYQLVAPFNNTFVSTGKLFLPTIIGAVFLPAIQYPSSHIVEVKRDHTNSAVTYGPTIAQNLAQDHVKFEAKLADGSALPGGISINQDTGVLSISKSVTYEASSYSIQVSVVPRTATNPVIIDVPIAPIQLTLLDTAMNLTNIEACGIAVGTAVNTQHCDLTPTGGRIDSFSAAVLNPAGGGNNFPPGIAFDAVTGKIKVVRENVAAFAPIRVTVTAHNLQYHIPVSYWLYGWGPQTGSAPAWYPVNDPMLSDGSIIFGTSNSFLIEKHPDIPLVHAQIISPSIEGMSVTAGVYGGVPTNPADVGSSKAITMRLRFLGMSPDQSITAGVTKNLEYDEFNPKASDFWPTLRVLGQLLTRYGMKGVAPELDPADPYSVIDMIPEIYAYQRRFIYVETLAPWCVSDLAPKVLPANGSIPEQLGCETGSAPYPIVYIRKGLWKLQTNSLERVKLLTQLFTYRQRTANQTNLTDLTSGIDQLSKSYDEQKDRHANWAPLYEKLTKLRDMTKAIFQLGLGESKFASELDFFNQYKLQPHGGLYSDSGYPNATVATDVSFGIGARVRFLPAEENLNSIILRSPFVSDNNRLPTLIQSGVMIGNSKVCDEQICRLRTGARITNVSSGRGPDNFASKRRGIAMDDNTVLENSFISTSCTRAESNFGETPACDLRDGYSYTLGVLVLDANTMVSNSVIDAQRVDLNAGAKVFDSRIVNQSGNLIMDVGAQVQNVKWATLPLTIGGQEHKASAALTFAKGTFKNAVGIQIYNGYLQSKLVAQGLSRSAACTARGCGQLVVNPNDTVPLDLNNEKVCGIAPNGFNQFNFSVSPKTIVTRADLVPMCHVQ